MKNILTILTMTAALLLTGCGSSSNYQVPVFSKTSQFDSSIVSNGERAFNGYQLTRKTVTLSPESDNPTVYDYVYHTTPGEIAETLKAQSYNERDKHVATYELVDGYIWAWETIATNFITRAERINYTYDTNGHLLGEYIGEEQIKRWEYDDQARAIAIRSLQSDDFTELSYSIEAGNLQAVVFDKSVLKNSGTNDIALTSSALYVFNDAGHMVSFEKWSGDTPGEGSLLVQGIREYDENGNLAKEEHYSPDREGVTRLTERVTYEYDALQGVELMNLALWNKYP